MVRLPDGQTVVVFGPKANCTLELCPVEWSVFEYRPSLGANVAFLVLFFLAMVIHIGLGIRWKSWWFMCCMVAGCIDEMIGYGGRLLMWQNPFNFNGFMVQIVCITTAPVFYTAAIYVTIAHTIRDLDPTVSRVPYKVYYWLFLVCDTISLVLQAAGGAMSTGSNGTSQVAVDIALGGLGFQVATLGIFCILFGDYLIRYYRRSSRRGSDSTADPMRLKIYLASLYAASLLIFARCCYRVDELSDGYSGELIHNEGLFIGLEGVLVVVASFALCIGNSAFVFKEPAHRPHDAEIATKVSDAEVAGVVEQA